MQILLLVAVFLPIAVGVGLTALRNERAVRAVSLSAVLLTTALVWVLLFTCPKDPYILFRFSDAVRFGVQLDGAGKLFAGMVSLLWPVALCYAFVYMKHDGRKNSYFRFYVMTYGVVLGVAFSSTAITMYVFYELLTFITLPLIIHTQTQEARRVGREYLYYSLSGSSLALAGIVIVTVRAGGCDFAYGGILGNMSTLTGFAYLLLFFGFGVKAAVFPLYRWLPRASAAPTPTTALLHAVAVVKSGAFAIIRMTYYAFSPALLCGTFAQRTAMAFAVFTVVFGSVMALKEQHLKQRFAYSTVANLSYILFGALLCTESGLEASFLHFLMHSLTKIGIFFACGAMIETSGAHYVSELNGLGKKMPKIFVLYTVSGLSLIGIPFFGGFVSKFYLIRSAFLSGDVLAYTGIGALICSAILTSVYVLSVSFRAFFRKPTPENELRFTNVKEVNGGFLFTTGIFSVLALLSGIFAMPICELLASLFGGGLV